MGTGHQGPSSLPSGLGTRGRGKDKASCRYLHIEADWDGGDSNRPRDGSMERASEGMGVDEGRTDHWWNYRREHMLVAVKMPDDSSPSSSSKIPLSSWANCKPCDVQKHPNLLNSWDSKAPNLCLEFLNSKKRMLGVEMEAWYGKEGKFLGTGMGMGGPRAANVKRICNQVVLVGILGERILRMPWQSGKKEDISSCGSPNTRSSFFNQAHDFAITDSTFNAAAGDIKNYYYLSTDEEKKLQDWLAAPDCSTNFTTALNQKVAETGQWIFKDPVYLEWKEKGSILWIQGKAGSGKTFLIIQFQLISY
ncbi:hypothetical protein FB446DRAFT_706308 [Lentinula raphanica]|nr:hypothetical protein FB446DRAFT_706308 [Lentinula raphanica]